MDLACSVNGLTSSKSTFSSGKVSIILPSSTAVISEQPCGLLYRCSLGLKLGRTGAVALFNNTGEDVL